MRLAYADPPYPRQAKKWYGEHKDYGGEVDHAALIAQLADYDGWALSTGAYALQEVLALCPPDVRVGVWHCTNTAHPGNMGTWWWSWEAVIVKRARPSQLVTRDIFIGPSPRGFLGGKIAGQKPTAFAEWVFALLGADPAEDTLDDMFPGSGACGKAWRMWCPLPFSAVSQTVVPLRDAHD